MENAEIDRLVMKPTARRRLGKYVLLGRLGHGGMGKIYLGYAPGPAGIEKLLVVKRLHGHLTGDPVLVNSFLDEARLSMALNHPNIVHTYDVGEVDGRYFMVMEYIEGQNLGVLLRTAKRSGTYPSSAVWSGLFLSVLDALHAAHTARDARGRELHIIHRDVSPQNILVTYDGLVKLVDFGIAKAAMRVSETDAGVLKGKYAYMSPEQVRGDVLDPRSDVFAAGIVLWEMLAGRRLYKAETIVRSVERILTEPVISPVRVNADCDPELAKVAFKALQKDREQRFSSALEMKEALDDAIRRTGHRVRQTEVKDLMERLFGDVIERQRAVLEACLSQADQPGTAAGDDDDNEPRQPGDSESDLSMKSLSRLAGEATTPSSLRHSPLVTAESEHGDERAATSLERRPRGTPSPPTPARSPDAVLAEITATAGAVTPPRRSRAPLLALLGLVVVVAVAFAGWRFIASGGAAALLAQGDAPAPAAGGATAGPATAGAAHDDASAHDEGADAAAATDDGSVQAGGAHADGSVQAEAAPAGGSVQAEAAQAEAAHDDAAPSAAAADDGAPAHHRRTRPPAHVTHRSEPREAPRPPPVEDKGPAELGALSLDTVPWTTVYLGKKKLGETPLVKVPVPVGAIELTLVNPQDNIREQYIANVKAGVEFRARLDLN